MYKIMLKKPLIRKCPSTMFRQWVVKFIHYQDVVVREMCLIQPIIGYRLPFYGKINKLSFFKAHQITNIGALIYDDAKCLNFYDNVLGLLQGHDGKPGDNTYEEPLSRAVIGLNKGEIYMYTPETETNRNSKIRFDSVRLSLYSVRFDST